jgi:hypothetical protein
MVDYDEAKRAVQDPNADPAFLARIAYENPSFDALVANHRRAYPGLLAWLAQFGTPEARRVLRMRTDLPEAVMRSLQESETAAQPTASATDSAPAHTTSQETDEEFKENGAPAQAYSDSEQQSRTAIHQPSASEQEQQAQSPIQPVTVTPQITTPATADAATTAANAQQPQVQTQSAVEPTQQPQEQEPQKQEPQEQPQEQQEPPVILTPLTQQLLAETGFKAETNVHGHTPAEAIDPHTSWMTQHDIAVQAPELLPFLALNTNIYPELKSWLANLGDPLINQALAGSTAPSGNEK